MAGRSRPTPPTRSAQNTSWETEVRSVMSVRVPPDHCHNPARNAPGGGAVSDSRYGRIRRGEMAADRFTQISNELFRDPRLSFKAKGVFGLISTHRDGYGITVVKI